MHIVDIWRCKIILKNGENHLQRQRTNYWENDKVLPDCKSTVSDAAKQEGTMKLFTPNVATNVTAIRSRNRQDKLLNIQRENLILLSW